MEELMELVYKMESRMVWITGPPGSGKTTTLYWLYKQCKNREDCCAIAIPTHMLECYLEDVQSMCVSDKSLYLFIDINKPLELSRDSLNSLERLLSGELLCFRPNVKLIIAVSSNFQLYLKTSSACTQLRSYFFQCPVYTTETFNSCQAREYLASITDEEEKKKIMSATNNIPGLLRLYPRTGEPNAFRYFMNNVRSSIMAEFEDVYRYITKANSCVLMLQLEAKLLWAVQVQLPYTLFGITSTNFQQLWLVKSYLVYIDDNEVPKLYYSLSNEEIQHFTMQLCNAYYSNVMKTDNINTVNDCFENSIPSLILPKVKYTLRAGSIFRTVELEFKPLPLALPEAGELAEDILYHTSTYFKAVDFIAIKKNVFGPGIDEGEYLIAFQVMAQKTALTHKLQSTINISEEYTRDKKGVLLILIFLNFTDFENNYQTFKGVTSSRNEAARKRFQNWWLGHLCDFKPVEAMYIKIKNSMYTGEAI